MASSNRHWPSMYRSSLACNIQQPQPDINNGVGGAGGKSSLMASRCDEGRNPEPRPRWNPRPEQIRILEGIFNSGMVNPPRDEIRRIRLQLSEYGPVGDANVFYWFQNRKSRTKHKLRAAGQLQPSGRAALAHACATSPPAPAPVTPPRHLLPAPVAAPTSSSSSSDRSSGSSKSVKPTAVALASSPAIQAGFLPATAMDFLKPVPAPARQLYHHSQIAAPTRTVHPTPESIFTSPDPFLQWQQSQYLPAIELGGLLGAQYAHTPAMHSPTIVSSNVVWGLCNEALGQDCINISSSDKGLGHVPYWDNGTDELMSTRTDAVSAVIRDDEKARLGSLHYDFGLTTTAAAAAAAASAPLAAPVHAADAASMFPCAAAAPINDVAATTSAVLTDQLQGLLEFGLIGRTAPPPTATVLAVARDAATSSCTSSSMQFSVPAATRLDVTQFGEAAVLLRHPGELVLVDESGVTLEPLQQDALYYVLVTGDDLLNTLYTE